MEAKMIVRRFTDTLEGDTDLEQATKTAQIKHDGDVLVAQRLEVQKKLEHVQGKVDNDFSAIEAERRALRKACDDFANETTPKKARWGFNRKTPQTQANELFQNPIIDDSKGLQNLVDNLDEKWRSQHGTAYNNFQRVCRTLHNHKAVFSIFPSESAYTSVLCGSLSLIIEASVNHETVAEFLSKSIAEISEKTAICADLIDVVREQRLQERLADIYSLLFRYYRDAMAWFLRSRASRFLGSFNEGLKTTYQEAIDEIKDRIGVLYQEAERVKHEKLGAIDRHLGVTNDHLEAINQHLEVINQREDDMMAEIFRQRQTQQSYALVGKEGLNMLEGIYSLHRRMELLLELQDQKIKRLEGDNTVREIPESRRLMETSSIDENCLTGKQLRAYADQLRPNIVGDEGQEFFGTGMFWLVDPMTLAKIGQWMTQTTSQVLWISSPDTTKPMSGARAAALSVVSSAWESKLPVISHFCKRVHPKYITRDLSIEQAGLIGLLYSLINQLQQFALDEDEIEIDEGLLRLLDGTEASWSTGLQVLACLLNSTPQLSYCVIDGLNTLEWSNGAGWCQELFAVLQEHQSRHPSFHLLVTTTGQSRFLAQLIGFKDRYTSSSTPRHVRIPRKVEKS